MELSTFSSGGLITKYIILLHRERFNNSALVDLRDYYMMKRNAIAKAGAIAVLAVLVVGGAVGLYFYTSAPSPNLSTASTSSTRSGTSTSSSSSSTQTGGLPAGSQGSDGQPQGAWLAYLGYIPSGYVLAPHFPNAATYPCPAGMDASSCKQFQASCGNGVCDPNESCATCPIDCGVSGQLTCDPYTGRPGAPISICFVGGAA
jgi:hypothetical protein